MIDVIDAPIVWMRQLWSSQRIIRRL